MKPTLAGARAVAAGCDRLLRLLLCGHGWVTASYLPSLARLARSRQRADQRRAAAGYVLLGDLHDLVGVPRAAVRAYQRSLALVPNSAHAWHAIGAMLDNMGRFREARHALRRALLLAPDDELLAGDLERVEWALLQPCPVLYEASSRLWQGAEALAAGRHRQALAWVGQRRTIPARQLRARIFTAQGDVERALGEWAAIAAMPGRVQLSHADWHYTLSSRTAEDPRLWRLMLWKIRPRLEGGTFVYSPTLAELDTPEGKRFELHVRFELARAERDVAALFALASKYPSWREPGEAALELG